MADETVRLVDLIEDAVQVELWCHAPGCHHHADVSAEDLIRRFGADHPVPDLARHFRCSKCGSRRIHTRPSWGTEGPGVIAAHGPSIVRR